MDNGAKNLSVCICQGCDIGKSLDVEALEKVTTEDGFEVDRCQSHPFLCGDEGVDIEGLADITALADPYGHFLVCLIHQSAPCSFAGP